MFKVAVLGDIDSIYGFSALGLEVFGVYDEADAKKTFSKLLAGDYAVIYVTEACGEFLLEEIEKTAESTTPAVILIPGIKGNTGKGLENVRKSVIKAVGSDIIFNN